MRTSFEIRQIRLRKLLSAYPHCNKITLGNFATTFPLKICDCYQRLFSFKKSTYLSKTYWRIINCKPSFLTLSAFKNIGDFSVFSPTSSTWSVTAELVTLVTVWMMWENVNGTALPEYNVIFKCKPWKFLEKNDNKKCSHTFLLVGYIRINIIIQVSFLNPGAEPTVTSLKAKQGHNPKQEVSAIYLSIYEGKTRKWFEKILKSFHSPKLEKILKVLIMIDYNYDKELG